MAGRSALARAPEEGPQTVMPTKQCGAGAYSITEREFAAQKK